MNKDEYKIWNVQLDSNHKEYQTVGLRRTPGHPTHEVVELDAELLIKLSDQALTGFILPPADEWSEGDRERLFEHLAPITSMERHPFMPRISFNEELVFSTPTGEQTTCRYIGYSNGRHRARYLYFAGAKTIPVQLPANEAAALRAYCASFIGIDPISCSGTSW